MERRTVVLPIRGQSHRVVTTASDGELKRLLAVDIEIPSGFTADQFTETVRLERQVFSTLVKASGILVQ